ncbi:SDR family NAD(P)-dependent oxidoreductase [Bacteroidia bacterium]|nr:SDR family NAD(P)-dependent oxidoreductase [Bacteroidia bacterium]MDB4107207.1 SDR family NAD(P)-dependent oxidoreductase [Bacteroidia bacterium]MDB9881877.1 SDR family NAD(P)-dependent oxidoreductase [Bacteroidia bacterium]
MNANLKNKVAIITGSSNGIGRQLAVELLSNEYIVILNGRTAERISKAKRELEGKYPLVDSFAGDVSSYQCANDLITFAENKYGRIDLLVNNAGATMNSTLIETSPTVFQKIYETNVFGANNMAIAALPALRKSKGSIIFTSSLAGIHGLPRFSAYSSSKMALRAIAESLRLEEVNTGVHVGLIYVGFTDNDPSKKCFNSSGELEPIANNTGFKTQSTDEVAKAILKNIERRQFITTLSSLGKLQMVLNRISPNILRLIIQKNYTKQLKKS